MVNSCKFKINKLLILIQINKVYISLLVWEFFFTFKV